MSIKTRWKNLSQGERIQISIVLILILPVVILGIIGSYIGVSIGKAICLITGFPEEHI
jgi:hypothetical protein